MESDTVFSSGFLLQINSILQIKKPSFSLDLFSIKILLARPAISAIYGFYNL